MANPTTWAALPTPWMAPRDCGATSETETVSPWAFCIEFYLCIVERICWILKDMVASHTQYSLPPSNIDNSHSDFALLFL